MIRPSLSSSRWRPFGGAGGEWALERRVELITCEDFRDCPERQPWVLTTDGHARLTQEEVRFWHMLSAVGGRRE
ncbi:Protein of unknown function [Gryllus bimaculatus]|nr:Protein of unknown function [Gryllus bimaculatus]